MANEVLSATPQKIKRSVCRAMFAAAVLLRARFDKIWQQISRYAPPQASQIGIAVTECGPLFFPMPIECFLRSSPSFARETRPKIIRSIPLIHDEGYLCVVVEAPRSSRDREGIGARRRARRWGGVDRK